MRRKFLSGGRSGSFYLFISRVIKQIPAVNVNSICKINY
jgi:hypothetical protein